MKKTTFEAAMNKGDRIEVAGYTTDTPGLVVHRAIVPGAGAVGNGWTITHEPSGYKLSSEVLPTRKAALEIARLLGEGIDWTRDGKSLSKDQQVALSVRAAYANALISKPRTWS